MKTIIILNSEQLNLVVGGDGPTSSSVEINLCLSSDIITGATCTGVGLLGQSDMNNGGGILDTVTTSALDLGQVFACNVLINLSENSITGEGNNNNHNHRRHHHH